MKAFIILAAGLLPFLYWSQIYNLIRFSGQKFTDDLELIKFVTNINANFKNKFSIWYVKDDQIWQEIAPKTEFPESQYQHHVSKTELLQQVANLFFRYQHDWTVKDFESMSEYIVEPFYSQQKQIFKNNFGNNFDIVYASQLSLVIPIWFEEQEDQCIFRVQINAEMINFKVSVNGYILKGKPDACSFSEYWDIGLDSENNWYLIKITQVNI